MDASLVSGLMTSLTATVELGKAALGVRDANQLAATVAQMNDKILHAQQSLFGVMAQSLALTQELANAQQENQKLRAAIEQRGRYALVELAEGQFVLRSKLESGTDSNPVDAEPVHHICQPCFDKGLKSVLQRRVQWGHAELFCTLCSQDWALE